MKIGLFCVGIGNSAHPDVLREAAVGAERLGFSTIWAPEHVVLFDSVKPRYPYSPDGTSHIAPEQSWFNPFLTLTYIAALTRKIRLATGVCLVPEHNPLILAKEIATLDRLSGGRFMLGTGIGWCEEEFNALGIPFARRAQRTREYIRLMRSLWSEECTTMHGEFVHVDGARSYPKPVNGAVPVVFGGESDPALRRAAEYGDGWFGFNLTPEGAANKRKQLLDLVVKNGRDPKQIEILISPYLLKVTPADLRRYRAAGVDELAVFVVLPPRSDEVAACLEKVAREWVQPAAALE